MKTITRRNWDRITAGHLLARAGFAALPAAVEEALEHTPDAVVDGLLAFQDAAAPGPPEWFGSDSANRQPPGVRDLTPDERRLAQQTFRRLQRERLVALRHWWLIRMRDTPHPLQEKLVLFWHGHFATSYAKVNSPHALYVQNQLFRDHAAGSWRACLQAVARDPAMLWYLDNALSRPEQPNENFARELMELFTLGEGQYTEEDIREAARAFTGLMLEPNRVAFVFRPRRHDNGRKSFMGRTGQFDADDIIDMLLDHPASAPFIVRKLTAYFLGVEPDPALLKALTDVFLAHDGDLSPVLRALFLSPSFYTDPVICAQIKSPAQWLVGACLMLDRPLPPAPVCSFMLGELGQDLFMPPNVKGWDGGYAWISTATLTRRQEYATALSTGWSATAVPGPMRRRHRELSFGPADPDAFLPAGARRSRDAALAYVERRFFHAPLRPQDKAYLSAMFDAWPEHPDEWSDAAMQRAVVNAMQLAAFQLT